MIKRFIPAITKKTAKAVERRIPEKKHSVDRDKISPLAIDVVDKLLDAGYEAYVVGGCIRDMLLGKAPKDFDVATSATPEQVKRLFRRARIIGRRFKIVHVQDRREIIEVTTFRGDHKSNSRHATQSSDGMLLRDNVYGTLEEDALRRDFTCNSLYYDIDSHEVVDFMDGLKDVKNGVLRTIGDPAERFKEDPVRMMRALRFQAKLGLKLDPDSRKQLSKNIGMIREVSAARLFDEVIKLLMHEKSPEAFDFMQKSGIFAQLFPPTAKRVDDDKQALAFLQIAMQGTANRLRQGKSVSPFYLYATLLWPAVEQEYQCQLDKKIPPSRAIEVAASKVLDLQMPLVSIAKRFSFSMRETWYLQTQLHRREAGRAFKLMDHPRFRAAYDFLLTREEAGAELNELGKWWTDFQAANDQEREKMVSALKGSTSNKRKPRRRPKKRTAKPRATD